MCSYFSGLYTCHIAALEFKLHKRSEVLPVILTPVALVLVTVSGTLCVLRKYFLNKGTHSSCITHVRSLSQLHTFCTNHLLLKVFYLFSAHTSLKNLNLAFQISWVIRSTCKYHIRYFIHKKLLYM